jgi:hypothetical protein
MRTANKRGRRRRERDTRMHADTHTQRYITRLCGVAYLKTVFLVTTVIMLKFHKLFTLKVIC